jgi:hypothetical protein
MLIPMSVRWSEGCEAPLTQWLTLLIFVPGVRPFRHGHFLWAGDQSEGEQDVGVGCQATGQATVRVERVERELPTDEQPTARGVTSGAAPRRRGAETIRDQLENPGRRVRYQRPAPI